MPTYRGINISLQTQYDARSIPEYPPLSVPLTPSPRKEHPSSNINTYKLTPPSASGASTPTLPRIAEVYIPIYAGSQFWIHYLCPEPPPHLDEPTLTNFFYFKLFLRGECVLSWGVGKEDAWAGKVSFGVYGSTSDFHGRPVLEKRGFFFDKEDGDQVPSDGFEIRVFRSRARRRGDVRMCGTWEKGADAGCGFRMDNIERMKRGEPKRMYTYALIDPVDQPYAVFRYHVRTAAQLEDMGFDLTSDFEVDVTPVPSPDLSPRSTFELGRSPPAPAIPQDTLTTGRLSYPPGIRLSPKKSQVIQEGSPVKKNRAPSPPRDAVDLSHHFHVLALADEDTSKSTSPTTPTWSLSKPLPDIPEKRESLNGISLTRSTSNVAETLKGLVQGRLKRRAESRDERTMSSSSS